MNNEFTLLRTIKNYSFTKKWPEFRARYFTELQQNPAAAELRDSEAKTLTLLFAANDAARNNAVVLREFLEGAAAGKRT